MNTEEILNRYNNEIFRRYNDLILYKDSSELDNKDLAKIFEYFTCYQLTLLSKGQDCFLIYEDIPLDFKEENKLSKIDTGIDCCNLKDTIVQCKLRKKNLSLTEVSTFLASQNSVNQNGEVIVRWKNMILYINSNCVLSPHLDEKVKFGLLKANLVNIQKELLPFCENLKLIDNKNVEKKYFELRDYQIECIDFISQNGNCICNLPTGTGKNRLMIHFMYENISKDKTKKYLVLVPRICLLEQIENEIKENYPILKDNIQTFSNLSKNVENNNKKNIYICVYNSIFKVEENIDLCQFDKIFIDEAHNIYTPNIYTLLDDKDEIEIEDEENVEDVNETFYDKIRSLKKYNNNVCLSATIDEMKGFRYFSRNIREMISNGYISDYNITIPIFTNSEEIYNKDNEIIEYQTICKYIVDNYRSYIIYCANRKDAKYINKILNKLRKNCSEFIDYETDTKTRQNILKKFKNQELSFIVNVEILIEGFDCAITKGVVLIHLPKSVIKIIQIIGRALRKHPEKNIANVVIPYFQSELENDSNNDKVLSYFLNALGKNDSRIQKSIRNKSNGGYINIHIEQDYKEDNKDNEEENILNIYEHVQDLVYESSQILFTANERALKLLEFVNKENRLPKATEEYDNFKIGSFWNEIKKGNNKNIYENILSKNDLIREAMNKYLEKKAERDKKEKLSPEEKALKLIEFVENENRLPKATEEYNDFKIGNFWHHTKAEGNDKDVYKNILSKNILLREEMDKYLVEKEEKLSPEEKAFKLIEFVKNEKRIPKKTEEYDGINIGGFWGSIKQGKTNRNKNIYKNILSKNDLIKETMDKFLDEKEERDKKEKLSSTEKALKLIKFIENEKRLPKQKEEYDGFKLGSYWDSIKQGKNKDVYKNILSKNSLIQEAMNKFLDNEDNEDEEDDEDDEDDEDIDLEKLNKKTVKELKNLAKLNKISGYSKLKKEELINLINSK